MHKGCKVPPAESGPGARAQEVCKAVGKTASPFLLSSFPRPNLRYKAVMRFLTPLRSIWPETNFARLQLENCAKPCRYTGCIDRISKVDFSKEIKFGDTESTILFFLRMKLIDQSLTSKMFYNFYPAIDNWSIFDFRFSRKRAGKQENCCSNCFSTMCVLKSLKSALATDIIIYIWVIGIVSNLIGRHGRIVISRYFNIRARKRKHVAREFYDTKSVGVDKSNWIH